MVQRQELESAKLGIKEKFFLLITSIYVIWLTFPLASYAFPISSSGILNAVTFITVLVLYPKAMMNKAFLWTLVYLGILFLYVQVGKEIPVGGGDYSGSRRLLIESAFILPSVAILSVLIYERKIKLFRGIAIIAILSLTISFVIIIPMLLVDGDLLRSTVEGEVRVTIPGVPYYTLVHAYALLLIPLLYVTKSATKKTSRMAWIFFALIGFIVFSSKVTTILLILIFSLFFYFINKKSTNRTLILAGILAFVFLVLYATGILNVILDWIAELFKSNEMYYKKIKAITSTLRHSSGDTYAVDVREYLHSKSWSAFFSNPITGSIGLGGHSGVLDRLGGLGLMGFIPFVLMIIYDIRITLKLFSSKFQKRYFIAASGMAILLLYEKGLFGQEGWLFFLVLCPSIMFLGINSFTNQIKIQYQDGM